MRISHWRDIKKCWLKERREKNKWVYKILRTAILSLWSNVNRHRIKKSKDKRAFWRKKLTRNSAQDFGIGKRYPTEKRILIDFRIWILRIEWNLIWMIFVSNINRYKILYAVCDIIPVRLWYWMVLMTIKAAKSNILERKGRESINKYFE